MCQEDRTPCPEEFIVHFDIYDPQLENFVKDGECGRIVLTTLLPVGGKTGNLLINYDTDDTTISVTRNKCKCGRTHLRILNPQRESETVWVGGLSFNRVDVEQGVFQRDNMDCLTGEYEAFLYGDGDETTLKVRMEVKSILRDVTMRWSKTISFKTFLKYKPGLQQAYLDGTFHMIIDFTESGDLEFYHVNGRPKRLVDRRLI